MAQALRKVWLEPEENDAIAPRIRPRRRQRAASTSFIKPNTVIALTAVLVACTLVYVSGFARIARFEMRKQALQQELTELNRDCKRLALEQQRLASQPRVLHIASMNGLGIPAADRVHYVRVKMEGAPQTTVAQASPDSDAGSWLDRSKGLLAALVGGAVQRLSRGPADAEYAQE